VLYLIVYLAMNLAAFAVIVIRERDSAQGDDIRALDGLGATQPWLAWPMTIAMLSLAGIPATAGFVGKFFLIQALVDGSYTWLAIVIVLGSAVSLGYYLRVVAAIWMGGRGERSGAGATARPLIAGGAPDADSSVATAGNHPEVALVAILFAAATIFFGIIPGPLFSLVHHAGDALAGIF
jgi:NADH-quinone oxidoreductase subunit N